MNSKILGLLAGCLLIATSASAETVYSWNISGVFFASQGSNLAGLPFAPPDGNDPNSTVAYSYTLNINNPTVPAACTLPSGSGCTYGTSGISVTNFTAGTLSGYTCDGGQGSFFNVFNNVTDLNGIPNSATTPGDSYFLAIDCVVNNKYSKFRIFFNTTDLNYITGPAVPNPPALTDVYDRTRWCQGADAADQSCGDWLVFGKNTSVTAAGVPEPGTLALLGLGLAGLGLRRRHKAA